MTRMEMVTDSARDWLQTLVRHWNNFWFAPSQPHTLAAIRIATGAMLLYTHLVLSLDLLAFLGNQAWLDNQTIRDLHIGTIGPRTADLGRSYLWHIQSPLLLWLHHVFAIAAAFALLVGAATRITAPLCWFIQIMYMHRLTGALFGLDQVVTMMLMYLMIAASGSVYSLDSVLRERWQDRLTQSSWHRWLLPPATATATNTVATRLLQLHLCVIYLFGGLWKARGETWWDGSALWFATANLEYQSLDVTWFAARYPRICSMLVHITVFWEVFYIALVWPKLTRPFVLMLAVAVHGGIALFLGMKTFGLIMIVANAIFIPPRITSGIVGRPAAVE